MKLDKNLTDSINYTQILFTDLGRLLVLIILDIIPIVDLVVLGYVCRVIKEPPDSKELPPLENYWDLWVQGLKIVVAAIIYMIIPMILIVPFVLLTVLAWMAFPILTGLTVIGWFVAIPMMIIGVLLAFFLAIALAMAIVNMVRKDSFGKAFAFGEILGVIGRVGWGTYVLWLIILFVCTLIIFGIGSIPAIGWILALIIAPIFGVFVARSASLTYLEGVSPEGPKAVEAPK